MQQGQETPVPHQLHQYVLTTKTTFFSTVCRFDHHFIASSTDMAEAPKQVYSSSLSVIRQCS